MNNSDVYSAVSPTTRDVITTWVRQTGETTARHVTRASGMSLLNGTEPIVGEVTDSVGRTAYVGVSFVTF